MVYFYFVKKKNDDNRLSALSVVIEILIYIHIVFYRSIVSQVRWCCKSPARVEKCEPYGTEKSNDLPGKFNFQYLTAATHSIVL